MRNDWCGWLPLEKETEQWRKQNLDLDYQLLKGEMGQRFFYSATTSTSSPRMGTVFGLFLVLLHNNLFCFVCVKDEVIVSIP